MVYFLRMQIKISTSQVQKTILAPAMQQSIEILLLPLTELSMAIEQELQNNPLLEVAEEENKSAPLDNIETLFNNQINRQRETDYIPGDNFHNEDEPYEY